MMSNISITHGGLDGTAAVILDGNDITTSIRGVDVQIGVRAPAQVTLDLAIINVDLVMGDPRIIIPDETVATLKALGWTEPEVSA